jgi:putative transposase
VSPPRPSSSSATWRHGTRPGERNASRGELLKVGIRVTKRTIQRHILAVRPPGDGQRWKTFLRNHVVWAVDFVTAQQLRQLTPFDEGPQFIIRDNDNEFGATFDRVAKGAGIRVLKTAVEAPLMNATCERFIGSARRECLDHVIIQRSALADRAR